MVCSICYKLWSFIFFLQGDLFHICIEDCRLWHDHGQYDPVVILDWKSWAWLELHNFSSLFCFFCLEVTGLVVMLALKVGLCWASLVLCFEYQNKIFLHEYKRRKKKWTLKCIYVFTWLETTAKGSLSLQEPLAEYILINLIEFHIWELLYLTHEKILWVKYYYFKSPKEF